MPRRQRVQPVLACARCYSLKKRCDRKLPTCTRCVGAGKECVGINRHSRSEVPRNALQYLEKRLAEVERDQAPLLIPQHVETTSHKAAPAVPIVSAHVYSQAVLSVGTSLRSLYTTTCVETHAGLLHESKLLYPTERPPHKLPVHGLYYEHLGKRAGDGKESQFTGLDALRIPFEVARRIFDNYVNTILPQYPCFTSNELWYHFGQVYSNQHGNNLSVPDVSRFIVSMVLAVGCLTSWRREFSRVAAMSESLYRDAIRHWAFLRRSNIIALQGILLLIQLGFYLPYINNVYYLGAEAVRMAIGLGLHQEPHPSQGLISRDISLRRQIFWMVYLVDRTIAISTGSPVCVSNDHITTALPTGEIRNNTVGSSTPQGDSRPNARHFLLQLQLCWLQSEIYEVKFFDRAIPDQFPTHADWVQDVERRVRDTLDSSTTAAGALPQWVANAAHLCQNLLHRPYPGELEPNRESLLAATISAIRLINGYHNTSQTSRLMRTFSVVDNAFQAAIVLLYIFGNYAYIVREASLEDELVRAIENLMIILDVGAQRWPVIAITSIYVRDLRDVVFSNQPESMESANDVKLRKELELLLSQRRIRSIYQANTEIQHAFQSQNPSPNGTTELPILDDIWEEFMDFDFGDVYSLNLLEPSWLVQEQLSLEQPLPLTTTTDSAADTQAPDLPKDIVDVLDSLPSCSFCRDQHIKCDRELPCCGACNRSQRECAYVDHMSSKEIPRSKIHDIIQRITTASQQVSSQPSSSISCTKPVPPDNTSHQWGLNLLIPGFTALEEVSCTQDEGSRVAGQAMAVDHIFLGDSSHLASIAAVLTHLTEHETPISGSAFSSERNSSHASSATLHHVSCPESSTVARLFAVFYKSVHVWYPVMHDDALQNLLSCRHEEHASGCLSRDQELFYLILAISSQLTKRAEPRIGFTPAAYFAKATSNVDTSCSHSSGSQTLHMMQRALLICIYLLLNPSQGDIWRNLGFAIRLYFDMSHGRFENLDSLDEWHLAMLSRTLYCIEGKITIAYGRPTVLITGDRLRTDLTQSISNTIEESLSIRFYQISTMRMQLQSLLISESSLQRGSEKLRPKYDALRQDVLHWHTSWSSEFIAAIIGEMHAWNKAVPYLEAWGMLQYHATIIMLSRLFSRSETAESVKQVVQSCRILTREHQYFSSVFSGDEMQCQLPTFPVDWSVSHLLFSAAIQLLSPELRNAMDRMDWGRTVRSCLGTMALLEADPANLSMGFSAILEKIQDTIETLI